MLSELGGGVVLRRAERGDLPRMLELLAADQLGARRESVDDLTPYEAAFTAIDTDPAQLLVVADTGGSVAGTGGSVADTGESVVGTGSSVAGTGDTVVGMFQLTFIPGLARRGALRAQIEAVRVAEEFRNRGLGGAMMRWAVDEARRRGCALVQLTSDRTRADAHRFYEKLGFVRSHDGFKLQM